jgi:hypothetical protein
LAFSVAILIAGVPVSGPPVLVEDS